MIASAELPAAEQIARTYAPLASIHSTVQGAIDVAGLTATPEHVAALVDAVPQPGTQLLRVTARNDTLESATEFANAVAESLASQIQASVVNPSTTREQQVGIRVDQLTGLVTEQTQRLTELFKLPRDAATEAEIGKVRAALIDATQRWAVASQLMQDLRDVEADGRMLARVAGRATGSPTPVQPQVLLDTLLGATVGLLLAIGVAYLVDVLDDRLLSPERLEQMTGLTVVGTVPVVELSATLVGSPTGQPLDRPVHVPEAFRVLWANLRPIMASNPAFRTLLITSTGASEGRTIAAAHLAVVAAQAGTDVILIDANLRRPALHTLFSVSNETGLMSLLTDQRVNVANVLVQTPVPRLWLLPSGPLPTHPGDWLGSGLMQTLLAELRSRANLILIDSPPVPVSDTVMLAAVAGGTLLVVDTQTQARQVAQGLASLHKSGTRMLGAVLNRVTVATLTAGTVAR